MSDGWIAACRVDELPEDEGYRVPLEPAIAVFKVGDELFAIDDLCTHDVSSLAEGYLDGDIVECAFHFAKFSLRTGEALSPPAPRGVRTYPTRVDGDSVLIDVSSRQDPDLTTGVSGDDQTRSGTVSSPRCGRKSLDCRSATGSRDVGDDGPGPDIRSCAS
jgi:3-phenylpropionate/trans-cinnamate dioxygenase ferredoxin component